MISKQPPHASPYEQLMTLSNELGLAASSNCTDSLKQLVDALIDAGHGDAVKQACWHPNTISSGQLVRRTTDSILTVNNDARLFRLDLFVMPVILVVGAQKTLSLIHI